ncbi:MAG: FHA domain-containing protein [Phycisphaeraceae bacterium]
MTPIELHILAGSHAGRRLLLEQPRITIGRSADNDVVIDLSYVSRRHAELRVEDGQWVLINHSPNGVRLNRHWVTDAPQLIEGLAQLRIGDEAILEIAPQLGAAFDEQTAAETDGGDRPGGGLSRRAKIWMAIGVYLIAMLGLFGFLATLSTDDGNDGVIRAPELELSAEQIRAEIHRDPQPQPPDERRARAALAEARELFNRRDSDSSARYQALARYREALAYMPDHELPEPIDRRRMRALQDELSEEVAQRYQRAYGLLRSGRYRQAWQAFNDLLRSYGAESDSRIVRNIVRHAATARELAEND